MKKFNLDPLALDKETIALLDERQLQAIVGGSGNGNDVPGEGGGVGSTGCGTGTSTCGNPGTSSGCDGGGSTC